MPTDSEILRREQRRTSFRLVPADDWRALLRTGANVLVTGPQNALSAFLEAARSELRNPVVTIGPFDPIRHVAGFVVLTDVDAFPAAHQQQLKRLMNEPAEVRGQILSMTTQPLLPLVQAEAFDAELYYRLNTIHLEIRAI